MEIAFGAHIDVVKHQQGVFRLTEDGFNTATGQDDAEFSFVLFCFDPGSRSPSALFDAQSETSPASLNDLLGRIGDEAAKRRPLLVYLRSSELKVGEGKPHLRVGKEVFPTLSLDAVLTRIRE